jgi:hypothetical protein
LKWLDQKLRLHWVPTQTIAIRRYAIPFSGAHIILASYRSHYIRIKRYVVYHKNSLDPREILQEKPFGWWVFHHGFLSIFP